MVSDQLSVVTAVIIGANLHTTGGKRNYHGPPVPAEDMDETIATIQYEKADKDS